jgi:serine/threonine protein kinase
MRKLCTGAHKNLIQIYNDGSLKNSTYYYIDMELCEYDLKACMDPKLRPPSPTQFPNRLPSSSEQWFTMTEVWTIMKNIANGLAFLHGHQEVHRDIKPRNSKPPKAKLLI